jgi:hypothetical protein
MANRLDYGLCHRRFISRQEKRVFLFSESFRLTLGPNGHRIPLPAVKRSGLEVGHLSSSRAEVKNKWRYACLLPLCRHTVGRDNFTVKYLHNVAFTCLFHEMPSIEIFLKRQAKKICREDIIIASGIVNTKLSGLLQN